MKLRLKRKIKTNEDSNHETLLDQQEDLKTNITINQSSDNKEKNIKNVKSNGKVDFKWIVVITISAFFISIIMSYFADLLLDNATIMISFIILISIILLGITFDSIGVAVTVADEKPFHSMAADKVKSAKSALKLIKNASKTASICNDVVGDICGIISGSSAAFIIVSVGNQYPILNTMILGILLSGFVASFTIGGKAIGKDLAINYSKEIVNAISKIISIFDRK